ncbi:putative ribonuclease H-like domain-containing protein [Tanacetum coccineum]
MLGKKPNKVYDPFLKAGLGYANFVRLKKVVAAQPKMYDGDLIHNNKLVIHTTDSEETLVDAEESRNKMRHKIIQIDYEKLNALYETFVPQQELSAEQTYFSILSTFENGSTSKDVPSESPGLKIPTGSRSLYKTLSEIKEELIEEVQEMLNIFMSMEQRVNDKSPTENILENEIDRLLEASLTNEIRNYVLLSVEQQKHELLKVKLEKSASDSRDIQANFLKRIKILENDFQRSQAQSIDFELKLQHQKEKMDCDVSWKAKFPVTADEKTQKKNDVKARRVLLMALPNEHILTFNQYKDAKTLFAAIQTRFGGNDATKKTQKTLLKQMYENFNAPSTESFDSIFNRLQKIVSQLGILGEIISQEDLNLNFLRSLPSEWNTHVVIWRNKPDLDTMSFDDLYNNFKIVEQEVKGTANSNSSSSSQYMAFMSSPSSTNEVNTAYEVNTTNIQVSPASTQDLEQIHEDDLEEMYLKWQLALLSMRTRKFFQKTGRKITINGSDTTGYDKSKVECFICHKTINVEEISSKAMLAIDGAGFDWSFMANKEVPSNMALMAFSDSEPEFKGYGPKISKSVSENLSNEVRKSPDGPLVEELVSDVDKFEKKTVFPTKIEFVKQQEKPDRKPTNCNYHQRERVVSGSNYTRVNYNYSAQKAHPSTQRNMAPKAVLMKTGLRPLNTARPVNPAHPKTTVYSARPMSHFSKSSQSTVKRPFYTRTTLTNKNLSQKVNTAKENFYTARPKAVNTARPNTTVVNAVRANKVNSVKASSCWVWRPTKLNSASITFKRHNYVDARGRSKLTSKEIDEDMLPMGGGAKGEELCVLFTDTGCFVLSPDFKLTDKSQVLLKVPRKNNIYSVDKKNIIPKEILTCLVAKATLDKSMLWHRRLGHINLKNINKLVKDNLTRGLPSKHFENDQTCVACLKGKQHKASFVTDDYSTFTLVFFLASKDETSDILKSFITQIENLVDKKVKIIRCDNGTEFKNRVMIAERRNRTLIKAARTMLADSKLPTIFWAEAVNTAFYVQNRVLVVKPHNKTPYELFRGRTPALNFMRPFRCHVTILNTLDHLGKFDGKSNDGFFVGYSFNSKAFRLYNIRTTKVEENLHVRFLEDKPIIAGAGLKWLFDIDVLTELMNYVPVVAGTNSKDSACTKENVGISHSSKETEYCQDFILTPLWKDGSLFDSSLKNASNDKPQPSNDTGMKDDDSEIDNQERPEKSAQDVNTAMPSINTATTNDNTGSLNINTGIPIVNTTPLEDIHADFFGDKTEVDMSNISTTYLVFPTPNTRIHKDHSLAQVIGDIQSGVLTRGMTKTINNQGFISAVYEGKTHEDLHTCLFACFLSQEEPKRIAKALSDSAWVETMHEELLQNKKDERGIVIRNKARLVAQGYTQEESIDYDEVFAPVARIETIRLFLAYASFIGFTVYQMDVKSAFLYGKIEEEVYVCQPLGFEDPNNPDKVYKVVKALYGLHQAPRAWYETLSKYILDNGFHRGKIDHTLFIKKQKGDILLVQVYVDDIIFGSTKKELYVKTASTPIYTENPLLKDSDGDDVDVHLYRSMIGSLMYLTSSRPDIMFAICACARFQVTPNVSHLHAIKRIFRYLKGQPKLGLWYPRDSPFDVVAYSDSDYAGASLDRKSTTGAEYVAAASCCRQVLWIQNQMLDYSTLISPSQSMANLEFCDKHNMVTYLEKSEGSKGFHQIVDFLTASHIRYALTKSTTIYVSLIEQFWQTATASTLENCDMETTATIDGKVKVVSKASIRRHLKLEDSDGISDLHTTEIFEQLALMGNMKRASKGYTRVDTPLFQTMLVQGQILQGEGSTIPVESHHTPIVAPSTSQPHHSPTFRDFIRQENEFPQLTSHTQTHVVDEAASTGVDVRH